MVRVNGYPQPRRVIWNRRRANRPHVEARLLQPSRHRNRGRIDAEHDRNDIVRSPGRDASCR